MYVNTFFIFVFKFQYNFRDSDTCGTFPDIFFFHGHVKYTPFKEKS